MIGSSPLDNQFFPSLQTPAPKVELSAKSDAQAQKQIVGEEPNKFQKTLQKEASPKKADESSSEVSSKSSTAKKTGGEVGETNAKAPSSKASNSKILSTKARPTPVAEQTEATYSEEKSPSLSPTQQVIVNFMEEMNARFGVEPEQLVQAMADLSEDELERTPESTMNLVLNQLNIKGNDRKEASQLYQEMLDATAALTAKQAQNQQAAPIVEMQVMSQKDVQLNDLNKGLENLNKKFFMADRKTKTNKPEVIKNNDIEEQAFAPNTLSMPQTNNVNQQQTFTDEQSSRKSSVLAGKQEFVHNFKGQNAKQQPQFVESARANGNSNPLAANSELKTDSIINPSELSLEAMNPQEQSLKALQTPMAAVGQTPIIDPEIATLQALDEKLQNLDEQMQSLANTSFMPEIEATTANPDKSTAFDKDKNSEEQTAKSLTELNAEATKGGEDNRFNSHLDANSFKESSKTETQAPANSGPVFVQNSSNERSEQIKNIQAIMSRAEILAQRGGGEVRVQLNPQNLGQVNLKVSLDDGKVNIQMITESEQAKRMIEGNIRELTQDFKSESLNLNKMQVDVGKGLSSDLKQNLDQQNGQHQPNADQTQDMARDFARGFLGQQRDERLWQREQSLMDPLSSRAGTSYAKTRLDDDKAEPASSSLGSSGKAKRLNVVA